MSITIPSKIAAGKAILKAFLDAIIDALTAIDAYIQAIVSTGTPNGSFESAGATATQAAAWTLANGTGGTVQRVSTQHTHGAYSLKFTRTLGASNTGGTAESLDYIPIAPGSYSIALWYWATVALESKVEILFYNESQSYISTATAHLLTGVIARRYLFEGDVPGGARYAKVRITGGTATVNLAGDAYFDDVGFSATGNRPIMDGLEYSTNQTSLTTVASIKIFIPSTATTLSITSNLKTDTGGLTASYRVNILTTNGTTQTTGSTAYTAKTSVITIPVAAKGTLATVNLQAAINGAGLAYIQNVSSIANGIESKITLT